MRSLGAQILQVDIDVNCECTSIRDLLSWAFSFVGFAELSDAQIKVNWLSYAVIYLFFYPLQQLKLSLRYLGHISWRILLYTRIPLNLPNEVLDVIPEVSDSRISASCLQDWLSSAFFFNFDTFCFFYPELRVYPERIMAEI